MADGSTQVSAEPRGTAPTREGDRGTGSGLDAAVAGGTALLTLYGLLAIALDLFFHSELVPDNGLAVAGIMIACLVVGGLIGAFVGSMADRD